MEVKKTGQFAVEFCQVADVIIQISSPLSRVPIHSPMKSGDSRMRIRTGRTPFGFTPRSATLKGKQGRRESAPTKRYFQNDERASIGTEACATN